MEELVDRLRLGLVRNILNVKEDKLDIHYITSSQGSFTRREIAKEIKNKTEVGIRHMESLLRLSVDLVEREKQKI